MADNIQPVNVTITPPTPPKIGNVASLVNPNTLSTLDSIKNPINFGDQLKDAAKQKLIQAATETTLTKLLKEKEQLIQEGIMLDIDHSKTLYTLDTKHKKTVKIVDGKTVEAEGELNDDQYKEAVAAEDKNYNESKKILQEKKDKNQKSIDAFLKDPFKKQKVAEKRRKIKEDKAKSKIQKEKAKAKSNRMKEAIKSAAKAKTIVPILINLLADQLAGIIAGNDRLKQLVNDTNIIITDANDSGDPSKLANARIARNNAIRIIQEVENRIQRILNLLSIIEIVLVIFDIIVMIISSLPIPVAVPPGIGLPLSLIMKFAKIIDMADKIVKALGSAVPIITNVLQKAIDLLEELKSQLLDINGQLESAATSGIKGTNSLLALDDGTGDDTGTGTGMNTNKLGATSEIYKGFTFAIREDNSFGGVKVGRFKRHYAVAIDENNVDVLKSEYSFTLDTNELIEQLKLVIDQQGLKTGSGLSSLNGNPNFNPNSNGGNNNNNNLNLSNNNQNQPTNPNSLKLPGLPSASAIAAASAAQKRTPTPPLVVIGPAGGTVAKLPLGIIDKAKLIAMAAASGPNPAPKIDVAFILAADKKWHDKDKEYQNSVINNTNFAT